MSFVYCEYGAETNSATWVSAGYESGGGSLSEGFGPTSGAVTVTPALSKASIKVVRANAAGSWGEAGLSILKGCTRVFTPGEGGTNPTAICPVTFPGWRPIGIKS